MTPLASKALSFVVEACGQRERRFGGGPEFQHPVRVAFAVAARRYSDEVVAAALLHDVVEDCGVTLAAVAERFGAAVASLVEQLTDVYTHEAFPDLNRAARKALEAKRPKTPEAIAIKLADVADNLATWDASDSFAPKYLAEKVDWLMVVMLDPLRDEALLNAAFAAASDLRSRVETYLADAPESVRSQQTTRA